jgi:hypothetical protein
MTKLKKSGSKQTCCFCRRKITDFGNNPWPANKDPDAVCCEACNATVVLPARWRELVRHPQHDPYAVKRALQ